MKKRVYLSDLRSKKTEEIQKELGEIRQQLYQLREKKVVEDLQNPFEIAEKRRAVSRRLTVLRERELEGQARNRKVPRRHRRKSEVAG